MAIPKKNKFYIIMHSIYFFIFIIYFFISKTLTYLSSGVMGTGPHIDSQRITAIEDFFLLHFVVLIYFIMSLFSLHKNNRRAAQYWCIFGFIILIFPLMINTLIRTKFSKEDLTGIYFPWSIPLDYSMNYESFDIPNTAVNIREEEFDEFGKNSLIRIDTTYNRSSYLTQDHNGVISIHSAQKKDGTLTTGGITGNNNEFSNFLIPIKSFTDVKLLKIAEVSH